MHWGSEWQTEENHRKITRCDEFSHRRTCRLQLCRMYLIQWGHLHLRYLSSFSLRDATCRSSESILTSKMDTQNCFCHKKKEVQTARGRDQVWIYVYLYLCWAFLFINHFQMSKSLYTKAAGKAHLSALSKITKQNASEIQTLILNDK